jgi:MscS family membrane protein
VITVSNAELAQLQIVNFTRRDRMLFHGVIGLRYETTTEQLRYVLTRIREMLIRHARVSPDPARVRFLDYGASSLDIEIFAYVSSSDYNEYLGIREDLNFRIKDIVEEAGTGFAFPSQTLYMARDSAPSTERAEEVAAEVGAWRADSRLPFPEFAEEERARLSDTLPFPPEGSPHHHPAEGPAEEPKGASGRRRSRRFGGVLGTRPGRGP